LVGRVQEHLEAIYDVRSEVRAHDFLLDRRAALALGASGQAREELLVLEGDDGLELGLYLSADLLERLRELESASGEQLVEEALGAYCELAEGVSHFLYVTQVAEQSRTVSLLELEAQAEVDKFASALLLTWGRGPTWAQQLLGRVFDQVRFHERLSDSERWRYEEANRLARNYCQRLLPLVAQGKLDRLLSTLRYSYRLGAEAKLRHLNG
jgi:hypothetical protein